ncbi:MAG: HD domain-containing protein [Candidatus Gracilibacteria bacterium]|nr:HD domain-containing protein [Candidatus Gracilibacteria bacterium]
MGNLREILLFLNKAEKLKTIKRQVAVSDNSRKESPAEHSWRMALMAMILHRELELDLDLLKAMKIIIVHDIIEAIADDVWILDKNDEKAKQNKQEKEYKAADEIFGMLPNGLGDEFKTFWYEFEDSASKEARFAKAIDKIEVIIQRNDLYVDNWERNDIFDVLLHRADDSVENFPDLKKLWNLVQEELVNQNNKKIN